MAVLTKTDAFIADPADVNYPLAPTSRVVDLNELEGDCDHGWGIVGEGVFIGPQDTSTRAVLARMDRHGDRLAAFHHGAGELVIPLMYKPPADGSRNLLDDAHTLADYLESGGVFALQLEGRDGYRYWDFQGSPTVTLIRGQRLPFQKVAHQGKMIDALIVRLWCENPFPHLAPVEFGPFTIANDLEEVGGVLQRHALIDNSAANLPSDLHLVLTPDGPVNEVRYGIRDHDNLTEWEGFYAAPAVDAGTGKVDTAAAVVADSSGSDAGSGRRAMVCTFATEPQMARRYREVRTLTDSDGMVGVHELVARLRAINGTVGTSLHKYKSYHSFSTADRAMENNPVVRWDWRDVDTPHFVEIPLGRIVIPKGAKTLVLELHAEQENGDQEFAFDGFALEPADLQRGIVYPPGFRLGAWGTERIEAEALEGTGEYKRGAYRLNANGEICRTDPSAGTVRAAGTHEAEVEAWIRVNPEVAGAEEAVFEVLYQPGTGSEAVRKSVKLRSMADHLWTRREKRVTYQVTAGEALAGDKFREQVRFTASTGNRRRVQVVHITRRFMESLAATQPLVMDSRERRAYAQNDTNDGEPLFDVIHENDPILAPPGNFALYVALGDRVVDPGYREADERKPTAKSVRDRSATLEGYIVPRVWGIG